MLNANNPNNNLNPWKPDQNGASFGQSRGHRDLARYLIRSMDGGKELIDAQVSIAMTLVIQ